MLLRTCLAVPLFLATTQVVALAADPTPIILNVTENAAGTQIAITGDQFGSALPNVWLRNTALVVNQNSDTSITATLPADTAAGAYLLRVQRDHPRLTTFFGAAIGQIGPLVRKVRRALLVQSVLWGPGMEARTHNPASPKPPCGYPGSLAFGDPGMEVRTHNPAFGHA